MLCSRYLTLIFILSNITFSTEVGNLGNYFDTFSFSDKWVKTWPMKERRGLFTLGNNKKLQRFTKILFWFIDGNNSSGSEDDYVLHSQRKLTKEGDQGRIKVDPYMNTFNESLLTDKSMPRSQIVL